MIDERTEKLKENMETCENQYTKNNKNKGTANLFKKKMREKNTKNNKTD